MLTRFGPQAEPTCCSRCAVGRRSGRRSRPRLTRPALRRSTSTMTRSAACSASRPRPSQASASRCCGRPAARRRAQAARRPSPRHRGKVTEAGFGPRRPARFRWQATLHGELLYAEEIAALAEAKRPLIRLRGAGRPDPALLDRLRRAPRTRMRTTEALGAVLAGTVELDGETVEVTAEGPLAELAARVAGTRARRSRRLRRPACRDAPPLPAAGLAWLARDVRRWARRLPRRRHGPRQDAPDHRAAPHRGRAGPTLVVCPTSLLGNWEREIRRFAPDDPVRRHHGAGRTCRPRRDEIVWSPTASPAATPRRSPSQLGPGRRRRGPAREEPRDRHRPRAPGDVPARPGSP